MDLLKGALFAAVVALTGCASGPDYRDVMQTYTGASQDQVIGKWGYPHRRYSTPSGEVFEYLRTSSTQTPMMINRVGNQSYAVGGGTQSYQCRTVFEFGAYGYVDRVSWDGNGCKAR